VQLRSECNLYAPQRSKTYDGTIGDAAHAARASRHNPNSAGVVTALDITHDPAHGMDCQKLFDYLRGHPHKDLAYIIHNRQRAAKADGWRVKPYTGTSDHKGHIHIAVGTGSDYNPKPPYDDTAPWGIANMGRLETEAAMINRLWLKPHNSSITGDMLVGPNGLRKVYGLEPLWVLAVTGAETSMGDPAQGGATARAYNFGNIRSNTDRTSKWAALATGVITTSTGTWWAYPNAWAGITAIGRLLKAGPTSRPGYYLERLRAGDWDGFYSTFHGADVPGYAANLANLKLIAATLRKKASAAGWKW
jgi:hypothetical protein